jgi:peptide-methionine (R)-S-oxide reductase
MANPSIEKQVQEMKESGRRRFLLSAVGFAAAGAVLWKGNVLATVFGALSADTRKSKPGLVTIVEFNDAGERGAKVKVQRVIKSEEEWKKLLTADQFYVTRQAGTERAFTSPLNDIKEKGIFRCICCDNALYSADAKFESGTGWPSFWQPITPENVTVGTDTSYGMVRDEVVCTKCDAHLGHVFDDGPRPTGKRYCMNGVAMKFLKFRE